jgi:hypothetical protein
MEITFQTDSTLDEGPFIRVFRSGHRLGRLGKIFRTAGVYRFYEGGEGQKLGGADLQDENLERLKAAIVLKYRQ